MRFWSSLLIFCILLFPCPGCFGRGEIVNTAVGHVVAKADGSLPKSNIITAPFQTVEVATERSTSFLAGNLGFLVAAVAVFLALRVPLMSKTMWTLAIVAVGYGVFSITFATFYTYIPMGDRLLREARNSAFVAQVRAGVHSLVPKVRGK